MLRLATTAEVQLPVEAVLPPLLRQKQYLILKSRLRKLMNINKHKANTGKVRT